MRTRRGLRDIRGVPTENLKGRPGQGYYIAVEVGTPPQRVSDLIYSFYKTGPGSTLSTYILLTVYQSNHHSVNFTYHNYNRLITVGKLY